MATNEKDKVCVRCKNAMHNITQDAEFIQLDCCKRNIHVQCLNIYITNQNNIYDIDCGRLYDNCNYCHCKMDITVNIVCVDDDTLTNIDDDKKRKINMQYINIFNIIFRLFCYMVTINLMLGFDIYVLHILSHIITTIIYTIYLCMYSDILTNNLINLFENNIYKPFVLPIVKHPNKNTIYVRIYNINWLTHEFTPEEDRKCKKYVYVIYSLCYVYPVAFMEFVYTYLHYINAIDSTIYTILHVTVIIQFSIVNSINLLYNDTLTFKKTGKIHININGEDLVV